MTMVIITLLIKKAPVIEDIEKEGVLPLESPSDLEEYQQSGELLKLRILKANYTI